MGSNFRVHTNNKNEKELKTSKHQPTEANESQMPTECIQTRIMAHIQKYGWDIEIIFGLLLEQRTVVYIKTQLQFENAR